MIPAGWERVSLGDIAQVTGGKRLPKGRTLEVDPTPHPYIRVSDMRMGKLDNLSIQYLPVDLGPVLKRYRVNAGDLIISVAGTLGVICRVPDDLHGANLTENADRISGFKCDSNFLFHALMDEKLQQVIQSSKTTNAQPKLALDKIRSFTISLPPKEEQGRIAATLETWDRAIETVEALIANAREQKQALMQQLLPQGTTSPKKRLPGFSGEWREVRLGNLVKEVSRDVEWDDEATYKLISVRRRSEGIFHRESLLGHEILTKAMKVALAGDFLISKMQIVHGASALVKGDFDGFNISGSYIALVPKDQAKLDIEYFDWYSRTPYFYKLAYISSYGVHIEKMTFNLKSFFKQTILISPSKAEQSAIVEQLNSAETLIGAYQQQADALRQEKAALMQQLLTGKRRVKLPESEVA